MVKVYLWLTRQAAMIIQGVRRYRYRTLLVFFVIWTLCALAQVLATISFLFAGALTLAGPALEQLLLSRPISFRETDAILLTFFYVTLSVAVYHPKVRSMADMFING